MRSSFFTAFALLALSSFSVATPHQDLVQRDVVVPRQNIARPTAGEGEAIVGDSSPISTADEPSATGKESGSGKASGSGKSGSKTIKIPTDAQVGGIAIITPNVYEQFPFYKDTDFVTFEWNYTSLIVTPTALNVVAVAGNNDYTIAANISAQQTKVIWDVAAYNAKATMRTPTEKYTLKIWDASKPSNAAPSPGYLAPYSGTAFGIYQPKPYVPFQSYVCISCPPSNDANTNKALAGMGIMGVITASSFVWFITRRFARLN
ncbi:hypothetical protein BZA77DRAFT_355597 [Pyronema omphalodes]|nr:hypothetical protein BZA77DRAFT_355597 [Pyronema omphalodes]